MLYESMNTAQYWCRAFVQEMSDMSSPQFDAAAIGTARHLPVESAMPGTTLQLIKLKTFDSGGVLYGTVCALPPALLPGT